MVQWCNNCKIGKDCLGYDKYPKENCDLYIQKKIGEK
jgi:hypothetical protein